MHPLINILIRTHRRPNGFKRCLRSIVNQKYPNIRVIIACDEYCDYVPKQLEIIQVTANRELPYFYDCYCNNLKAQVTDGWFLFFDDDDVLVDNVLNEIEFDAPAILVQLRRGDYICPQGLDFRRGLIGMPCLILHHSLKDLADIPGTGQGDYFWIKKVCDNLSVKFVPKVVVQSFSRGLGKPELNSFQNSQTVILNR